MRRDGRLPLPLLPTLTLLLVTGLLSTVPAAAADAHAAPPMDVELVVEDASGDVRRVDGTPSPRAALDLLRMESRVEGAVLVFVLEFADGAFRPGDRIDLMIAFRDSTPEGNASQVHAVHEFGPEGYGSYATRRDGGPESRIDVRVETVVQDGTVELRLDRSVIPDDASCFFPGARVEHPWRRNASPRQDGIDDIAPAERSCDVDPPAQMETAATHSPYGPPPQVVVNGGNPPPTPTPTPPLPFVVPMPGLLALGVAVGAAAMLARMARGE